MFDLKVIVKCLLSKLLLLYPIFLNDVIEFAVIGIPKILQIPRNVNVSLIPTAAKFFMVLMWIGEGSISMPEMHCGLM